MTDQSTNKPEQLREAVSRIYARAVASSSSCCSPTAEQKGTAVKFAGYDSAELDDLPAEAVVNSFGCGNPLAFSDVRPGEVVLDLGSGAGIDLLLAARKVGPTGRVIGVDMTDEMIARARASIAAAGLTNVEVRKGLIEDLPVESDSVDWVISNCVINLSPEKDRVFAEIARVLKPGGRMLVSDIVARDLPQAVLDSLELYASCIAGAIDEDAYCDGLRRAGLTDVEVRERIVYDAAQLEGIVVAGQGESDSGGCCGGPRDDSADRSRPASVSELASVCAAKVWSAKIFARKPA
jgi:SAM-dependent methyltransferase